MVNEVTRNLRRNRSVIFTKRQIGNVNRLCFIQISKRLKKDTGAQVNNSTFIFITDKVFGFPEIERETK